MYFKNNVIVFIVFVMILLSSISQAEEMITIDPIILITQEDIQDAKKLDTALSNVTIKVMSCMDTSKSNAECQCDYLEDIKSYQAVLGEVLEKHPEWRDNVTYYEDENGTGHTTSLIGHQRQSQMIDELPCNQEKDN